jgi:hypothetical protein
LEKRKNMRLVVENAFMKKSNLFFLLLLFATVCYSQSNIPIGAWRTHFNYTNVSKIVAASADSRIYAATKNAIFYIDQTDNSINKLTKIDGLSAACISSLNYEEGTLAIGYCNGNVDFVNGNTITNFNILATVPQLADRTIKVVRINKSKAYIGTSIGVVVVDMPTKNIIESYTEIGAAATRVNVNDILVSTDSLFVATTTGLLSAPLSTQFNLQDFKNWRGSQPNILSNNISQIGTSQGKVVAVANNKLWEYASGVWRDISGKINNDLIFNLKATPNGFLLTSGTLSGTYNTYDSDFKLIFSSSKNYTDAAIYDGNFYAATKSNGVLKSTGASEQLLIINGPDTDDIVNLEPVGERVYAFSRYTSSSRQPLNISSSFSFFENGIWESTEIPNFGDVASISTNGKFLGSYGKGLFDIENNLIIDDSGNSPLIAGNFADQGPLISDINSDKNGALWVANYDANPSLHRLNTDGSWQSIVLSSQLVGRYPVSLAISPRSGAVWVTLDPIFGGGAFVHSPAENRTVQISRTTNNLPSNIINAVAIDNKDEVWLGTDDGIAIFSASNSPFFNDFNRAITPFLNGEPLLKNSFVSALEIDGGNRKWIGTRNGLWLFGENGDKTIHHFTTRNSPLPSDTIVDIAINNKNGEVFIATTAGIVSYRSDATIASAQFVTVKIFPNPILPNYSGTIGIEGLGNNATVKITDVSGNLVRELQANGGSASWDGLNLSGVKPSSGVYLLFAATSDGSTSYVGKFAMVE